MIPKNVRKVNQKIQKYPTEIKKTAPKRYKNAIKPEWFLAVFP
jgi:predicted Ser/Thr protein kinase